MTTDCCTLAYLAGAMDSDGCFGIKKSTYGMRVLRTSTQPVYSERILLKQVTNDIPLLLRECFGGYIRLDKPGTSNSKPIYDYAATDRNAARACELLLPYLRIKRRQAELLLELRQTKNSKYWKPAYWFALEFPNWHDLEMVTRDDAARMLGYNSTSSISQAIRHGTLLALPYDHRAIVKPAIPRLLVERVISLLSSDGRAIIRPPHLIAWRDRIWSDVRELNRIGINGTPTYHRTGCHAPAA